MSSLSTRHLAAGAAVVASLFAAAPALAVDAGQTAPGFTLPAKDGSTTKLADLRGKVVWVDFWASWCGPCRQSFPWMNSVIKRYPELQVVGINVDQKREDADRFLAKTPADFNIAFDTKGATPTAYAAKGMPTSYLIGKDGKVLMVHSGFTSGDVPELEASIAKALGVAPR
ncbi:TlpA disulfide reductase family protein [soil metagenome]